MGSVFQGKGSACPKIQHSDRALSMVGPQRRGRGSSRGLVLEPPVSQAKMVDFAPTPQGASWRGRQGRGGWSEECFRNIIWPQSGDWTPQTQGKTRAWEVDSNSKEDLGGSYSLMDFVVSWMMFYSFFFKGAFGELSFRLHFPCMCPFWARDGIWSPRAGALGAVAQIVIRVLGVRAPPTSSADPLPGPATWSSRWTQWGVGGAEAMHLCYGSRHGTRTAVERAPGVVGFRAESPAIPFWLMDWLFSDGWVASKSTCVSLTTVPHWSRQHPVVFWTGFEM